MVKAGITFGDFNGISPEISVKALNILDLPEQNIVLFTSEVILDYYERNFGLKLNGNYEIINIPCNENDIIPGKETKEAGEFSFNCLKTACDAVKNKKINALVTAPVSKNAMHLAGHFYDGQTEVLQKFLAAPSQKAEMLFTCGDFSVLLLTRHVALKQVPEMIKKEMIVDKVSRTIDALKTYYGYANPVCGISALNPHAGENGLFGDEEANEIIPAINELKKRGYNISGPFPADALFLSIDEKKFDCYFAMYHDQGLIPVKLKERNNCVNTTIGLDILRTSPAHGTAFDIAGKNVANPMSMVAALKSALRLN